MQDAHIKAPEEHKSDQTERAKDATMKTLALLGLAGLLALVSFGVVKFAPSVIRSVTAGAVSLSSKFIPIGNKLSLLSDSKEVESGHAFTLSWKKDFDEAGSYSLFYPCKGDFQLEAIETETDNDIKIACSSDFEFISEGDTVSLVPTLGGEKDIEVPITLNFTKEGDEKATYSSKVSLAFSPTSKETSANTESDTNIITTPSSSPSPSKTSAPSPSPKPSPTPSRTPEYHTPVYTRPKYNQPTYTYTPSTQYYPSENPAGTSDLAIVILETGVMNSRNQFIPESKIDSNDTAAVRFEVVNIGNKQSGPWNFESELPTDRNYTFRSDEEPSLMPGDRMEFTLSFDEFEDTSTLRFTIEVDPNDRVDESNERNNDADVTIKVD